MPADNDAIRGEMLLKRKMDEQGRIGSYKACLVAKCHVQKDDADLDEKSTRVKAFDVPSIAGKCTSVSCNVPHADISTAFLNGSIEDDLYVQ